MTAGFSVQQWGYAAAAGSTSQNTNPSRCTVSPTWQAIGALKMGPA
jgi:hypothetical protein